MSEKERRRPMKETERDENGESTWEIELGDDDGGNEPDEPIGVGALIDSVTASVQFRIGSAGPILHRRQVADRRSSTAVRKWTTLWHSLLITQFESPTSTDELLPLSQCSFKGTEPAPGCHTVTAGCAELAADMHGLVGSSINAASSIARVLDSACSKPAS
jgi:hypothetical protein